MVFLNKLWETSEATSETTSEVSETSSLDFSSIWHSIVAWCKTEGIKILIAFIVLIIVFLIINGLAKSVRSSLRRHHKEENICNAVYNIIRKVLKVVALIVFLGYIGIDMAGVSSIIASLTVALGLALQGSLSNVAGWVIIIVTRPFKLGDFIQAQGESGTVEEINLFYTHLKSTDNKVILIPNGNLSGGNIINYSRKEVRRVDMVFSISYESDASKAVDVINKTIVSHPLSLLEPSPFVRVSSYKDSCVEITSRVWAKSADYWTLYFDLMTQVRNALEENGINIPYNQLDVNIVTREKSKK